jgi:uncharacterized membrane protein AbrB (regulator of aidB expression)
MIVRVTLRFCLFHIFSVLWWRRFGLGLAPTLRFAVAIFAAVEASAFKFWLVSDFVGAILLVLRIRCFAFVTLSLPWWLAALGTLVTGSTLGAECVEGE